MNDSEITRYAEFCQFRKEIRHPGACLIVGIDVAKDPHHAFFGNAFGRTLLRRLIFENNATGFQRLLERAGQLQRQHGLSRAKQNNNKVKPHIPIGSRGKPADTAHFEASRLVGGRRLLKQKPLVASPPASLRISGYRLKPNSSD